MSAVNSANTGPCSELDLKPETGDKCHKKEEETSNEEKGSNEAMTCDALPPGDRGLPVALLPPALGACSIQISPCDENDLSPEIGEDHNVHLPEENIPKESDALISRPATSRAVPGAPSRSTNDTLVEDVIQELCERAHEHSQSNNYEEEGCCDCVQCTCCTKKTDLLFKSMHRAKKEGWAMFKRIAFPLVRNIVRFVWIAFELITAVVAFVLSLSSTLKQDPAEVFNYVHLGLTATSIALAMVDLLTNLRCRHCHQAYDIAPDPSCSRRWCACCSKYTDIVRMLLAEALIYPLIICDLFEIVTRKSFKGRIVTDHISFTLFIISCLSFVLYVFVARIAILGGIIFKTQRARMRNTFAQSYKETYSISALFYQLTFLLHLLFQMVTQVLTLITIGACIYFENRHFYEDGNTDTSIRVSARLWIMMAIGYIIPVIGFFSFFLVTYYWAQEFPVALALDLISCWKMKHGPDDFIDFRRTIQQPRDEIIKTFSEFLNLQELKSDFQELHDQEWCIKFVYPFRMPTTVIVCLFYAILHVVYGFLAPFILRAAYESANIDAFGDSWFIYFNTATGVNVIANAYAIIVAVFWGYIFPVLFVQSTIITVVFFSLPLLCLYLIFWTK